MLFFVDPLQQLQDLCLYRHIKRCRRFIRDQQFWFVYHCRGDHHALSLPAGKFMGICRIDPLRIRESHITQCFHGTRPAFLFGQIRMDAKALLHLPADGAHRIQGGHRFLKDHSDVRSS